MADWKSDQARAWGSAPWHSIAATMCPAVHGELVTRLEPHPGDRWTDVATGTGSVALRAARAGAQVSALDLSPALARTARALAAEQNLTARFETGDVERLPHADSSFEIVSSAHGVVFAADRGAVASELARVCRPGGRLGLTYWRSNPGLEQLTARIRYDRPANAGNPRKWRRRRHVNRLLGAAFELDFVKATCFWTAESGEAAWRLFSSSDVPARSSLPALPPPAREALHRDWVDYLERHRRDGLVSVPRLYLLILGSRRAGAA